MNQSEIDMFFWDQVADDWAELAAKPIIMSEAPNNKAIRRFAEIEIAKGRVRDSARAFLHRKYGREWGLEPSEVDQLLAMQVAADGTSVTEVENSILVDHDQLASGRTNKEL